jgi:murein DD-endopeptidase MepM/ murein hydrolase activator NlpD
VNVSVGKNVRQGAVIGKAGSTGRSTAPHLHFAILKNGRTMNPLDYVK